MLEVNAIYRFHTERLVHGGACIARHEGMTVFVHGAAPNEIVDAKITTRKKGYAEAEVVGVVEPSSVRSMPVCKFFGECGGCMWQHIEYPAQVDAKLNIFIEQLERIGKFDASMLPKVETIVSEPYGYRRIARMYIKNGVLGFRRRKSRNVVAVDSCAVLDESLNLAIGDFAPLVSSISEGELRILRCATEDEIAVYVWSRNPITNPAQLAKQMMMRQNVAVVVVRTGKEVYTFGEALCMLDESLYSSPLAFVQANSTVNSKMRMWVRESLLSVSEQIAGDYILELYAGSGNFTRELAFVAQSLGIGSVIAEESSRQAVEIGRASAKSWQAGELVRWLPTPVSKMSKLIPSGKAAVMLFDPPRSGAKDVYGLIDELMPPVVLSISCDTATHARDLKEFVSKGYGVRKLALADQFPHTYHSETMALLTL